MVDGRHGEGDEGEERSSYISNDRSQVVHEGCAGKRPESKERRNIESDVCAASQKQPRMTERKGKEESCKEEAI